MLLFLRGSARLRPETPDLMIRLGLHDRVFTTTTRRTLSGTALAPHLACVFALGLEGAFRQAWSAALYLDLADGTRSQGPWPRGQLRPGSSARYHPRPPAATGKNTKSQPDDRQQ